MRNDLDLDVRVIQTEWRLVPLAQILPVLLLAMHTAHCFATSVLQAKR